MAPTLSQPYVTKPADEPSPGIQYKFWVEVDDTVVAEFKECSGIRMERETEPVKEGGQNEYVHLLPGRNKYFPIVLKYGITDSTALWDWYRAGLYDGKVTRKSISILLRNVEGDVVRRWNVTNAYPTKWDGPQLNTESSQVAIETLELAHHGLSLGE
jgi:phage tail-like protein